MVLEEYWEDAGRRRDICQVRRRCLGNFLV
jgi:hypothetical protein